MIASFILAGMVIAFALSMLFTAITIKPVTSYPKIQLELTSLQLLGCDV